MKKQKDYEILPLRDEKDVAELKRKLKQVRRRLNYHGLNWGKITTVGGDIRFPIMFITKTGQRREIAYCTISRNSAGKWKLRLNPSPWLRELIES